jgi:intraflagellar transport protein 52
VPLHEGDALEPDISNDIKLLPDIETLADRPKPCLQEVEELPRDWNTLFDSSLYALDMRHVPAAVGLYGALGVKKAALTLIPPSFEAPLPALQPATFPPAIREPPPPALELFDLDEAFASEQVRGQDP